MKLKLVFCHRLPERTFKIGNYYFPVCSRCTGLYIGLIPAIILLQYLEYHPIFVLIGLLMIIPTLLDGFSQYCGLRISKNLIRFITGVMGGIGLAIIIKTFTHYVI